MPPLAYLAVAGLDEVATRDLVARRTLLLDAIGSAGPGEVPGALAGVLALTAVIAEQNVRATTYAEYSDRPYWCRCGMQCRGLAAIDGHLDAFGLDDDAHYEVTETSQSMTPDLT